MGFKNPVLTEIKMSPFTSQCGRIKDRNTGIDCHECRKGCWKIKEHSSCTGTVISELRDAAKDMWDSGHHLFNIGHILLG